MGASVPKILQVQRQGRVQALCALMEKVPCSAQSCKSSCASLTASVWVLGVPAALAPCLPTHGSHKAELDFPAAAFTF